MESEEITTNISETETTNEETPTESTDNSLSDENNGTSDVEGSRSDLSTEQSEGESSDAETDIIGTESNDDISNDNETSGRTFTQEEMEQIISSVLANEREAEETELQTEEVEELPRTLFNTPLEEYSVSESLLVCIFLLMLTNFIHSIFKGSHWFGKL